METVRRLGVVVATQASMQYQFAPLLVRRFGADPVGKATPIRSWLDAGVMVAGGSDSPVTPYPPLLGLWHSMTRFVDQLGVPVGANESITPEEALRLYTRNAAWLCFSEHERGALIPGFVGDWVALSVDPLADPPDTLKDARVLATSVAGEIVYAAERH
jgi:predicted amidohydrolase YtcJ